MGIIDDGTRLANGYAVIQSFELDGLEIIIGENPEADKPYMLWRRSLGEPFGAENHLIPIFSDDYLKAVREFIQCLTVYDDNLDLDRVYRGSPLADFTLRPKHCVPGSLGEDLVGRIVAVKPEVLAPEHRSRSRQLMRCDAGFGCSPNARGKAVYCTNIYSGETACLSRSDILGVVAPEFIPEWAEKRLAALDKKGRPAATRESFEEKAQRLAEAARESAKQCKARDHGSPEI